MNDEDLDMLDDQQDLSVDDILEEERQARDPNIDFLKHRSSLPQDFDTPATPLDDPLTRDLPDDHPALDSNLDEHEKYDADATDASEFWANHESNDRKNDALDGDNGPDL